jgi:hypothetical protein
VLCAGRRRSSLPRRSGPGPLPRKGLSQPPIQEGIPAFTGTGRRNVFPQKLTHRSSRPATYHTRRTPPSILHPPSSIFHLPSLRRSFSLYQPRTTNNRTPTTDHQQPPTPPNISRIRNGRQHVHAASVEVITEPETVFSRIRSDFSHDATSPFCTDEPDPEAHPGSRTQALARAAAQEAQAANAEAEADAPEPAAPRAQPLPGAEYKPLAGTVDAGPGTAGTRNRPGRKPGDAQSVTDVDRRTGTSIPRPAPLQPGSGSMMIL